MPRSRSAATLALLVLCAACSGGGASPTTPATTATTAEATTAASTTSSTLPATTTTEMPPTTTTLPSGIWQGVGTPESRGLESGALADLVEQIDTRYPDIDAVSIVRNGTLVLDAAFYPHRADVPHQVYSVTKSIVSTLVGIAIDRGLLGGLDTPVVDLLAEHAPGDVDERKAAMTLEDVLTMSTGLDCRDSYLYRWVGLGEMAAGDDWAAHVLGLPMRDDPGTTFEYCNGASHLLSTMLSEATGGPALDFAHETLFGPLGIEDVTWREAPGSVSVGYAGIALRTADMAKIGWLYLQDGMWNGDRVMPSGWADAATTRHIDAGTVADGYGYQWWVGDGFAAAVGYGGQYILLVPELDLVAAFVAGLSRNPAVPEDLLSRYIVPAIVSDGTIPDDPEGAARLEGAIAAAAATPPTEALSVSAIAAEIDGIPHVFDDNAGGFEWFVLDVDGDTLTLSLEDVDGPIEVTAAFDGHFYENDAWGTVWAFRPEWTSDDTLTIDFRMVGDAGRGDFEFVVEEDRVHMWYREMVFGTSVLATARRDAPVVSVPDLPAPTVDGTIERGEWAGAATTTMDDGSEVSWLHADGYLYVAVETGAGGSKNLAIAEGDRVRILHSSTALGSAEYALTDGVWRLTRDFDWCCRDGVRGDDAAALEAAEGWLANIAYDGPHEQVEFRVAWPEAGARVALSHVPAHGEPAFWPVWLGSGGEEALTGAREEAEVFEVGRWVVLERAGE